MPDVTITVGRKQFTVACQEGEEPFLKTAAEMLDQEATALVAQIGQLPESRMLLMAGLMLADRTAAYEERARVAEEKLAEMERRITALEAGGIPPEAMARLAALADRAEALARDAEEAGAA